ncbi:hypothetical protein [Kitasatospora purpeofusca]|uniref:hypothetical protein n=1 Tax=Kitasatospora purpeofusca TaxID=67352 RepID=UPI002253BB63|nr:hypothetical protein [Kitasatospora purpeofusca]MCX4755172.1 hypothetical protein [Kitasatospora purpeofusca]WSR36942.1 hypothetical protein OG715_41835 [Kitasatospora purpeofusca]WSR45226.1 hypothetical protein OG196_42725 [Kitasatospora purpeofusca]
MSFTGFWVVMPVPASVVEEVAPVLAPPIEHRRTSGPARRAMERWAGGGPDGLDMPLLHDLASPDLLDDHLDLLFDVWEAHANAGPFLKSACRKGYPAVGLAHALGPDRFRALPGWFGNFVLTRDQVRTTLPAVEAALTLLPSERRSAEVRLREVLEEVSAEDADTLLDSPLPTWRRAAAAGQGLTGAQVTP